MPECEKLQDQEVIDGEGETILEVSKQLCQRLTSTICCDSVTDKVIFCKSFPYNLLIFYKNGLLLGSKNPSIKRNVDGMETAHGHYDQARELSGLPISI